jgi:hypothetical protein
MPRLLHVSESSRLLSLRLRGIGAPVLCTDSTALESHPALTLILQQSTQLPADRVVFDQERVVTER